MKIEKTSISEYYNVETEKYDISVEYIQLFNIGYNDLNIIGVQDKNGLEVILSIAEERHLKKEILNNLEK